MTDAESSSTPPPPPPPPARGIRTELLEGGFAEVSTTRVAIQSKQMLKVHLGEPVLARQGSMVAYQGSGFDFAHKGSGAARFLKKAVTGEGLDLMTVSGSGDLFLGVGQDVHLVWLDDAGLSVNGANVLAFEATLAWDINRVKGGVGTVAAGGLFNTTFTGTGWVAILTDGVPVVLRTDQPTFVDTNAVVAWSANLEASVVRTMKAGALIGRGSGEAAQLSLRGDGIVIVQPSEGRPVLPT